MNESESRRRLISLEEFAEEEWVQLMGGLEVMDTRCDEKTSGSSVCIGDHVDSEERLEVFSIAYLPFTNRSMDGIDSRTYESIFRFTASGFVSFLALSSLPNYTPPSPSFPSPLSRWGPFEWSCRGIPVMNHIPHEPSVEH